MTRSPKVRRTSRRLVYSALVSIVASTSALAQYSESFDCSRTLTVDNVSYDLKKLDNEHALKRTRKTPPTTVEDEFRFNICHDLSFKESIPEGDKCPTDTRACLIETNMKPGEKERIVTVIPVAKFSVLKPSYSPLRSPDGLCIQLHGESYPPPDSDELSVPQSLNLTLLCTESSDSDPIFVGYESGIVSVTWNTSAGCPVKSGDGGSDSRDRDSSGGHSTGGSGIGWFFLLLCISFLGYFIVGAYYNYNNFGATGWDLIPHRDFWRDVPYLLRDFADHLCTTLRPGRQGGSRRGYVAV